MQPVGGAWPLPQQSGPAPRWPRRLAIGEARCLSRPATAQRTSSTAEGLGSESCGALGAGGLRGAAGWTRRALGGGLPPAAMTLAVCLSAGAPGV